MRKEKLRAPKQFLHIVNDASKVWSAAKTWEDLGE